MNLAIIGATGNVGRKTIEVLEKSNLKINKQDYNFNGELFPPKIQCPSKFTKCPCLSHE